MDRRRCLLDAATAVVGAHGMRGLTHRAVDTAAGLSAGSTSNVFRSRDELVQGLVDHILAGESADVAAALSAGAGVADWAHALGAFAVHATGPAAGRSRARFALAMDPLSQPAVRAARAAIVDEGERRLAAVGHPDARAAAEVALALVDGVVLAGVALDRRLDDAEVVAALRDVLDPLRM